ncbi:hypothetical protein BDY19DRAFT_993232 [Irpex rosettiformis]|uniref:Uncharacterized protein n=1 Tax=Irpex rosettiformis TaxID=378272 RepID=A0ACB8U5J9_9APHY|nr:hypothetical protein BDY19DRAFT_993232 [Irpex rosettiformis]
MHRGKTFDEVPEDYIEWCIRTGLPEKWKDFGRALEQYESRQLAGLPTKERLQAVAQRIPAWLYKACDTAYEDAHSEMLQGLYDGREFKEFEREKAEAMEKMARSFAHSYLPRPPNSATLPNTELVQDLRTVLSLLPEHAWDIRKLYDRSPCADATNSVYVHFDGFTGNDYLLLTERRCREIKHFLRLIEIKHGRLARLVAQWEVYDKVAKSIGGIMYSTAYGDEKGFYDPAKEWVTVQVNR